MPPPSDQNPSPASSHGDLAAAQERIAALEALCDQHYRSYQRVARSYDALLGQVTDALSTPEHHHTMQGGMPFCSCWHSLRGDEGRAHEVLIEHLLDVVRQERDPSHKDGADDART